MAVLKLHGGVLSTATMRAAACLYEKDLEFTFIPVDMSKGEHKNESFISLNPFGQVPAFQDGDLTLFESRAITKYICHAYAKKGPELIPAEPKKMGPVLVWIEVEALQFDSAASKLVWELVFKPMFGMTTDSAAVAELQEKLAKVLDIYEARLSNAKYLGGAEFSLADLHHLPSLQYLMSTPAKEVFSSRPHVAAWCAHIMARPAWAKVIAMQKR
ncbi:glutathione S-transferase-like [Tasmannia lanceolata]|uniref:glutathione S-transferase-like n=1 Tax=Tasmannia lanceolata TaxID=3420 RepID=UPI00406490E6